MPVWKYEDYACCWAKIMPYSFGMKPVLNKPEIFHINEEYICSYSLALWWLTKGFDQWFIAGYLISALSSLLSLSHFTAYTYIVRVIWIHPPIPSARQR
jgi:hypothetical protein